MKVNNMMDKTTTDVFIYLQMWKQKLGVFLKVAAVNCQPDVQTHTWRDC